MHDRRVVASEGLPDLGQRQVGELAAQVHGDLAGLDDVVAALRGTHLLDRDAEVDGALAHDEADGDLVVVRVGHEVLEHHLREVEVDALLVQRRPRADANESALQLTDIRGDARGHVFEDLRGHLEALGVRLLMQDRDAGLQVRRLNVDEQARGEARPHAVLEALELGGGQVGGQDDLLVGAVQRIKGMEEAFDRLFLVADELDVVDEKDVEFAVAAVEGLDLGVVRLVQTNRVDELVRELFGVDVADLQVGHHRQRVVADGLEQVRLAQTGIAVDKEGIEGGARRFRGGQRGGVRETVRRADDEGVEGELRVEVGRAGVGGRGDEGGGVVLLVLIERRGRGGRMRGGCGGGRLLLFLFFRDDLERGVDRDGDADGAAQVHGQGGRQLRLRLVFNPLLGEIVGDGEEDRAFDVAEGPGRAQHRRGDGPQLVGGDCVQGRSPRACEGIRLHGNLRSQILVSSVTTSR